MKQNIKVSLMLSNPCCSESKQLIEKIIEVDVPHVNPKTPLMQEMNKTIINDAVQDFIGTVITHDYEIL